MVAGIVFLTKTSSGRHWEMLQFMTLKTTTVSSSANSLYVAIHHIIYRWILCRRVLNDIQYHFRKILCGSLVVIVTSLMSTSSSPYSWITYSMALTQPKHKTSFIRPGLISYSTQCQLLALPCHQIWLYPTVRFYADQCSQEFIFLSCMLFQEVSVWFL